MSCESAMLSDCVILVFYASFLSHDLYTCDTRTHIERDRQADSRTAPERQTGAAELWRRSGSISSGWSSSGTPRWASRVWSGGSQRAASPRCRTPPSAWTSSPGWWRSSRANGSSCRSGTPPDRSASGGNSWELLCVRVWVYGCECVRTSVNHWSWKIMGFMLFNAQVFPC